MGRPRKPQWHDHTHRWRSFFDGKVAAFPRSIGRYDKPLIAGIPKAAWEYLAALEEAAAVAGPGQDPTVHWLVELYLAWSQGEADAGRIGQGQLDATASRLALFKNRPGVADRKARTFPLEELEGFFDWMRSTGYADHYVAGVGRSVRACWRWGARALPGRTPSRLLVENPFDGYQFPKAPGAVRGYVEGAVVRRFLRWAWSRARSHGEGTAARRHERLFILMLWFLRLTGARPGEACGLLWSDIDWPAGKIVLPPERHKTGRKTRRERVVYLTAPVVRLLRAIERLDGRHSTHVFTHRRCFNREAAGGEGPLAGQPWPSGSAASQRVRMLRRVAIAAQIAGVERTGPKKLVAYAARHGYISEAVSSGLSVGQVANLVGNTAAVLEQVYAHAIGADDAERARQLMNRGKGRG